ncbi:MAG: PEP-CTERM sorting domain-containing protein [Phycisphaerae bacterium]
MIDLSDAGILLANWSGDAESLNQIQAQIQAVPEPMTVGLLAFGGLICLPRRRPNA